MNVLVTGGAGYIGSHILKTLAAGGHAPVAYDNLSHGHAEAVGGAPLIRADVGDERELTQALREHAIDLVIHMAAFIEAGESVEQPARYFHNNTVGALVLLEAMRAAGVKRLVFSSTAAVYGRCTSAAIGEDERLEPVNPYGASKLCAEMMLRAYARAYGLGCVALRYFNVAGASSEGEIGEDHDPETHLIPLALRVALGGRESLEVFGDDYDTPDGTCIRDYIHVMDLAEAHCLAAQAVVPGAAKVYNLGSGTGFSVRQILQTCREVTGHPIPATVVARRAGDPDRLVACPDRAEAELGWRRRHGEVTTIVRDAWQWHRGHPQGYRKPR